MSAQETMAPETTSPPTGAFQVTVKQSALVHELTIAQGVVERKTTIPILSNCLFEVTDGKLLLTATNLDLTLQTTCEAEVVKSGSCTIPAIRLLDYAKLLPDADIVLKLLENNWVSIRCGRSHTKLFGLTRANFPTTQPFPTSGVVSIKAEVLSNLLERVSFAISQEESRYTINGALMIIKAESITMIATDGHRLAHVQRQGENFDSVSGEMKTLIPKRTITELKRLLDSAKVDTVDFAKDDRGIFFRVGPRLLISHLLAGHFPNYESVMPKNPTKVVEVNSEALADAVLRVNQFSDERSSAVRLRLEPGEIVLSASSSESGQAEDAVEVDYKGDPMTIGFNGRYITDFLRAIDDKKVLIEMTTPDSAAQFSPVNDNYKYKYVVMPMRV